jgi:Na+/H+-dicarboxylate symporter/ABC-type amino acid transport substrate-binding protein
MTATAKPARRSLRTIPMPIWVVVGAIGGIVAGVVLGERTSFLQPVGSAYAMMLRIAVYPYLLCALIYGIGRLTPAMAAKLFHAGWGVYAFLWCVTLGSIWLLGAVIPPTPPPILLTPATANVGANLLDRLIPANLFDALSHDYVPAIAVFAIVYGIALQKIERKSALFEVLEAIQVASVTLWGWIVRFAPIGVFALFAVAAGTIEPERLSGLALYVGLFLVGTLLLAFLVLPAALAALAPVSHREILKELQPALVIAVVTTLSVVALPFVQRAAERVATEAGCPQSEERDNVIRAVLALSYVLAQLGNYFLYLLMLYGTYAYKVPLTMVEELVLPLWTLLSGLGSPTAIVDGVVFLGNWLRLPPELMDLFLETWTVTRYGQVILSVMGFSFATILVPLVYFGKVRLRPHRASVGLALTVASFALVIIGGTALRPLLPHSLGNGIADLTIDRQLADGLEVTVIRPPGAAAAAAPDRDLTPAAIRASGVLRVGYNADSPPFSYWNARGQLVGYDISFAYELARSLGVRLELIPYEWRNLDRDLVDRRFQVAMSAIYETDERLQSLEPSHSYYHDLLVLVVPSDRAHNFIDRAEVAAMPALRLAVQEGPGLTPMIHSLFPSAAITVLPGDGILPALQGGRIDAMVWPLAQAKAWAASHAGFTAVVPAHSLHPVLFTYMMPPGAEAFRHYVDQWLELKTSEGFRAAQIDYWMKGMARADRPRRWNLLDATLAAWRGP